MLKIFFLTISILSLLYGILFLFLPYLFVDISVAKITNIAWLRSIGASIIGVLFFGCLSIYLNPIGKFELLKIIILTSFLQTSGLIYSRFKSEFSAQNLLVIDLTILLAIVTTLIFLIIAVYRKKFFE
tara:strand:+ start:223 stop:606 length:384 start_codon:yes stop_codon:yes gene_type:complete